LTDLLWMAGSDGICATWSPAPATCDGDGDRQRRRWRQSQWQVHPESSGARRGYQEEGNEEEDEDPGARPRTRQLGEAEGRRRALNKHCWNSNWCPRRVGKRFSCTKQIWNAISRYIPGIYLVYTSVTRNPCTWYIPGIYLIYTLESMLVYTRYIPGIYQV